MYIQYNILFCWLCQSQDDSCSHSVTLVVDEDVSRQVTLNREGEVIIGASMVVNLPYSDGKIRRLIYCIFLFHRVFFRLFGGTLIEIFLLKSVHVNPFLTVKVNTVFQQNEHFRLLVFCVYYLSIVRVYYFMFTTSF